MKIKIVKEFRTKGEWFLAGEEHEARRLSYALIDFTTPFQIVSGPKSGHSVPFKHAMILPDEPRPTQQQYDRLSQQNADLLDELEQINAVIGKCDGQLVDAVLQLVQDKAELLQKIERHTDEQLNSEKLLQRIRELETVAGGRAEFITTFTDKLVPYVNNEEMGLHEVIDRILEELEELRSAQKPVELPQDVVDALDSLKSSRHNAAQIIRLALDGNNGPSESQSLYQFVSTRTGLNELIYALVYGYTAAPEKDEAASMLEGVTALVEKWYHAPCANDDKEVLVERICDFIREREIADSNKWIF
ncbi:hypothetical protein ACFQ5D_09430 [Paenibacillus farraposensis]|uniref:Uncharacterized protein n=1 Tax=Paenibacillus farraposensis TaxID=2807095 RepID=A0ABW4DC50_9BACL|nr:hypothetical protein [Paenibacillus farraposensis]MCC3379860.1 hypothetical protein [Paenibacillus farraposensis]